MTPDYAQIAGVQLDDDTPPADLTARYRAGSSLLREATAGLTGDQLLSYPVADKMSVQEVACHVADCEQFLADRMKRTIAMERPLLVGVEGEFYLEALHYAERDLELDLSLVAVTRDQMAADLERLDDTAWQRTAVHTETGLVTLRQLLLHAIRHLEWHVGTIAEKRQAMGVDS